MVKNMLDSDIKNLTDKTIDEALDNYSKTYTSIEHDSKSLLGLIDTLQYLKEDHKLQSTPVDIFKTISHEEFKMIVKEIFTKENRYLKIHRDYYFFPYDLRAFRGILFVLFLVLFFNLHHIDRSKCLQRKIIFSRKISNPVLAFVYIVIVLFISMILWEWVKHLFLKYIMGDAYILQTIDVPYSYLLTLLNVSMMTIIFILLNRYIFKYYSKIQATQDALCIVGTQIKSIPKQEILEFKKQTWSVKKSFEIFGLSMLFWRPLLRINLKNGQVYYLRSNNAKHLKEDLEDWLKS